MAMIPVKTLSYKDTAFRLSFPEKTPVSLIASIKKVGILNPIIVRKISFEKKLQIISGFRRTAVGIRLGYEKIPAAIYTKKELSDRKALFIAFYDNLATRGFNLMEKSILLDKLVTLGALSEEDVIADVLPALGIDPNRFMFEKYLKLSSLPHGGQMALAEGKISLSTAEHILHFPSHERKIIISLLKELQIGKNKAETIVNLLFDITKREHTACKKILSEKYPGDILSNKELSGIDKYHHIEKYLFQRRYPFLSDIQRDISLSIRALKLPKTIKITPPPNLEGENLNIECRVRNKKDLTGIIKTLKKLSQNPKLFQILKKI